MTPCGVLVDAVNSYRSPTHSTCMYVHVYLGWTVFTGSGLHDVCTCVRLCVSVGPFRFQALFVCCLNTHAYVHVG